MATTAHPRSPEWLKNRQRLGDLVDARRQELELTVEQLAERSHTTGQTIRRIIHRQSDIQLPRRRALERALHWAKHSIDEVLAGGDPTPLSTAVPTPPPQTGGAGFRWLDHPTVRDYWLTETIGDREITVHYPGSTDELPDEVERKLRRALAHMRLVIEAQ